MNSKTLLRLPLAVLLALAAVFLLVPASALANTPPVAEDDVYDTGVDEPLSVLAPGVLDNDSDDDADPLEAVLVSDPDEGGTLEFYADGSFDYTPPAGYIGNDAFTYRPFDGTDLGNLAEVTVRIGAPAGPYTIYFDEAAYLSGLADLGHVPMSEGFEDNAAWGSARSPLHATERPEPGDHLDFQQRRQRGDDGIRPRADGRLRVLLPTPRQLRHRHRLPHPRQLHRWLDRDRHRRPVRRGRLDRG